MRPIKATTAVACGWILACILAGFVAFRTGIPIVLTAEAIGLGLAPGVVTLALAARAREGWAQVTIVYAWIAFAGAAMGAAGGFASPASALFLLAPAFAARIGGPALAGESAFFAALGYGLAGLLSADAAPVLTLGPLPAIAAGAALIAAGALIAASAPDRPTSRARPVSGPVPAPVPAPVSGPVSGPGATPVAARVAEPAALATPDARDVDAERARREAAMMIAAHRRRAAELAHELRTPLNHILGFADVMRQRLFGPMHDKYGEYVDLIHTSGRNLLDLVNGLLDLSRLEAGKYPLAVDTFDFRFIGEEVVRLAHDQAHDKKITLSLEADEEIKVRADARALRQILVNLMANALKFTPEGGAVIVRAHAEKAFLTLEVEDTGPGIAPAERARLARAFERGAGVQDVEGYGLGLSLVVAFAALHDGALSMHEAPGGGLLARVRLPVIEP